VNKKKDSLPVRRGGLDRQQRRGAAKKIPLCGFASLRLCVNKKRMSRKEGESLRSKHLSGLACLSADRLLCETLIKKTLAKKDNLSQAGSSFFSREGAEAQRNGPVNTNPGLTLHLTFTYRQY